MARRLILRGDIVGPDRLVADGALVVEDDRVEAVLSSVPTLGGERVRHVAGWIAPGFVDLHSDAIEKEIRPRPNAEMPLDLALVELDRKLAGHGVVTIAHALCFSETDGNARCHLESEATARRIVAFAPAGLVRHLVHCRYEMTDIGAAGTVQRVIEDGIAAALSFMDHAPGGRQFGSVEAFARYYSPVYGLELSAARRLAEEKLQRRVQGADLLRLAIEGLAATARRCGIPLASHDDETLAHVAWAAGLGATIAEFPVSLQAARAARDAGLHVAMGAPNLLRGRSTSGNLSAVDALRAGVLDSVCSDYYPAALLHTVSKLAGSRILDLPAAVRLVSLHPARALGLSEIGSLEPGKQADVICVGARGGVPVVTRTFHAGQEVYAADRQPERAARQVAAAG